MAKPKKIPKDHLGNVIEIGDAYFYGSPPRAGKVTAIKGSAIEVTYFTYEWEKTLEAWKQSEITATMTCKSPEKGICLDKTYDKKIV